ncbi:MAG TPA: flagellar hook capping FlgD N-terminal domain-containing protein [Kofleriaceae bacterium]
MSVNSITGTTDSSTTASTPKTQLTGSKDEFLKMFMAQLQNQDPLQPQDNSQMVAQLATFSQVEQQEQTNQQLSAMSASQSSSANANMASLVGRQCSATVGDVEIKDPSNIPPIEVTGATKGGSMVITDSNGKEIRKIAIPDGGGEVKWDGKDANGNAVAAGSYSIAVSNPDATVDVSATWKGTVSSLELEASGARLVMGGISISPATITSIGAQSTITDSITSALNAASTTINTTNAQGTNS